MMNGKYLTIRATVVERERWAKAAGVMGVSLSAWVREVLEAGAKSDLGEPDAAVVAERVTVPRPGEVFVVPVVAKEEVRDGGKQVQAGTGSARMREPGEEEGVDPDVPMPEPQRAQAGEAAPRILRDDTGIHVTPVAAHEDRAYDDRVLEPNEDGLPNPNYQPRPGTRKVKAIPKSGRIQARLKALGVKKGTA